MTDPTHLSKTPLFMCDSYRLFALDIQEQGIYGHGDYYWLIRADIIPDWSEGTPVSFHMTVETYEQAAEIADEIERLAA